MTTDLYTAAEIKKIREQLLQEQEGKDAVTNLLIPSKQACLDHVHDDEQLVRAILHRQINSFLGKIENNWTRMIAWWYPYDLPTLLEQCAKYLREYPKDKRYRHPKWIDKLKTQFNYCYCKQQDEILESLGYLKGKNTQERKEIFAKLVLDRKLGFDIIKGMIDKVKEKYD